MTHMPGAYPPTASLKDQTINPNANESYDEPELTEHIRAQSN